MKADNAINLVDVTKKFDEVTAVREFNAEIKKGEFFSLLGPSGCGKTTTLRMIAGLEVPTEGHILLEGSDVSSTPAYRRNVNTVFQDYALFPHMSVRKNIYFPLKMKRIPLSEAQPRIERVLRLVNMEGFGNRLPQQLSGGQRQRIALARALVLHPDLLILDEPTSSLDRTIQFQVIELLKSLQHRHGLSYIFISHDLKVVKGLCHDIVIMKEGKIVEEGEARKIFSSPQHPYTKELLATAFEN
jgi:spermidine/putrescine transport system ATP-binding protein